MQEDNRFFRFVWRLDSILLALGGLLVIVLLAIELLAGLLRPSNEAPEGNFRPAPKNAEQNYTYRLEDQTESASLPGQKVLALRRWKGAPSSYGLAMERVRFASSSIRFEDAVNLLAIETENGASRWLFGGFKRSIVSQEAIYSGGAQTPAQLAQMASSPPIALVIHTVDTDTNNDGELDGKDVQSFYYFRPHDTRATKFFSADYLISAGEADNGDYLIVYEKGRSAFAATFHVPDFKLKSTNKIPDVPG